MADEVQTTADTQHPKISKGIIQALQTFWNDHEFEDLKVIVEGTTFSCHSVILALCSEFFRGLLRSNMREKKEMKVELNNLSSSTFQLILNSLYTGSDLLTVENVTDVWAAVHQLQIQFLIEHCEDFVMNNLTIDTVEVFKDHAEYLQSENVKPYILRFMLENFEELRQKDLFVRLDFDYLMKLVENDELEVSSEDLVLYSIFEWVSYGNACNTKLNQTKTSMTKKDVLLNAEHGIDSKQNLIKSSTESSNVNFNVNSITEDNQGDLQNGEAEFNDRKHLLIPLLKASRYYLASETCIVKLYKDKLIESDLFVKEILFAAIDFKWCGYRHNYCPQQAINRSCSIIEHVALYCDKRKLRAISFEQATQFRIQKLPKDLDATVTIIEDQLYVCLLGICPTEVYVLQTNMWEQVTEITHGVQLLLTHEKYIYAIDHDGVNITRFNTETSPIYQEIFTHEIDNLAYALSFHKKIVFFRSVVENGVEETAVHSWNTETNVWTNHGNLKLFAQNLQSFQDDVNTYILDTYGNLWKMANSENIGFSFVAKLWTEKYNIKGAILLGETLHLMIGFTAGEIEVGDSCEGVFTSLFYWDVGEKASNVMHCTWPRTQILES